MKTLYTLFLVLVLGGLFGCAQWKPIGRAEFLSMTNDNFKKGQNFTELGEVEAQYCTNESQDTVLTLKKGEGDIGMIDEVIMRAQKQKDAIAIKSASIEQSANCVRLTGMAVK